jgi:hypothetical protein
MIYRVWYYLQFQAYADGVLEHTPYRKEELIGTHVCVQVCVHIVQAYPY